MSIRYVVLDFDGTCTRVIDTAAAYLAEARRLLAAEIGDSAVADWERALATVRARSPLAGWMLAGAPSAPAGADPYILAGETAAYLMRRLAPGRKPPDVHSRAYAKAPSAWRPEAAGVLDELVRRGFTVRFVSNSSTAKIEKRLDELHLEHRNAIEVLGDAAKFAIREPSLDDDRIDPGRRAAFARLPAAESAAGLERPVYLRRGAYFEALCRVWGADADGAAKTIVCGDVYELDLAMPAYLGCHVHLIGRAAPYATYDYERHALQSHRPRAGASDDLRGLLARLS
jgi:phosphoglycolate phosphatase-like HAD superfamily hydrolase